jgi:predicted CXXCH cytochrome family protein
MRSLQIRFLALAGCILIVSGIGILVFGSQTVSAQDAERTYVGSQECASCHRSLARAHSESPHAQALQDVSKNKKLILADFKQGEDLRQVQFPGEDAARAFTAKDIAFAIGSGQHAQAYLYKVDRNEYKVLPALWNAETQAWEPLKLGDTWPSDSYDWAQNCAYCHTTGYDAERARWKDAGVQCEACHGPASEHVSIAKKARDPNDQELADIRAAINPAADPQVCGQCHSRGSEPDNHLPFPLNYRPGANLLDAKIFTLVSKDDSSDWWNTGHARQQNMQFNEWLSSAHADSLNTMRKSDQAADKCLGCHSQDYRRVQDLRAQVDSGDRKGAPPDAITLDTAQFGVTCTSCHSIHNSAQDVPDNLIKEAPALCTDCHTNPEGDTIHHPVMQMFQGVALVPGIEGVPGAHFSAENGPTCTTCHMQAVPVGSGTTSRASHLFTPVLPGKNEELPSACASCHKDLTTSDLQSLVENTQAVVRSRLSAAYARLGSITEPTVDDASRTEYDQVVAALSFVQNDGSLGVHNYAYVDRLLSTAEHVLSTLSQGGGTLQPTEAPAPTATPLASTIIVRAANESVPASGVRPVTILILSIIVLIVLTAAFFFFRKSGTQES